MTEDEARAWRQGRDAHQSQLENGFHPAPRWPANTPLRRAWEKGWVSYQEEFGSGVMRRELKKGGTSPTFLHLMDETRPMSMGCKVPTPGPCSICGWSPTDAAPWTCQHLPRKKDDFIAYFDPDDTKGEGKVGKWGRGKYRGRSAR